MDGATRKALDRVLATFGDGPAELLLDDAGPAIYRLHPTALTVVGCVACHYVGLIPSIPKVPELVWDCGSCHRKVALRPPAKVWLEGNRPVVVS